MLDRLYKKLHIIFVCGMALIISIIFGVLLNNNIKEENSSDIILVQRIATLIIYQLENNSNNFKNIIENYVQPDTLFCSVKTMTGETFYQSESNFPTPAESLLNQLSNQNQFRMTPSYGTSFATTVTEQNGPAYINGKNKDFYMGISALVISKDNNAYYLALLYKSKTNREILQKYAPFYLTVWAISLICVIILSHFVLKQAFRPSIEALDSQKEFIASASHELKSPLAVLFANVEKLGKLNIYNNEIKKSAQIMDRECIRMNRLVSDLLSLASFDTKQKNIAKKEINVDTLLISLYEKYETVCTKHNIILGLDMNETSYPLVFSDPELITQILSIFMDNAISHSHHSQSIEIKTSLTSKNITFCIMDHGRGISEHDRPFIFNRFYCADKSHSDKQHFGLGLSIAKELSAMLNGKIGFHDTPGGGAAFYITVPIK